MSLKVTSWNVEDSSKLVVDHPEIDILERQERIRQTVREINPDILCLIEGPRGETKITKFCIDVLNGGWVPILFPLAGKPLGTHDKDYQMQGNQWIWFLVRKSLESSCTLQNPTTWQYYTECKEWPVYLWGKPESQLLSHYRHPQVMIYDLGNGRNIEFIGVHLKSKINLQPVQKDSKGNLIGTYLDEALTARIRLATEARNIRQYIGKKFEQVPYPGIVVMGDCNDGPGHDFFERMYLFFDLIGNIQGDVMFAERFFNHALFDFPGDLRWTTKYPDEVSNPPLKAKDNPLLLDNIFISQALCRRQLPLVANEHAGRVEHEIFDRVNAGASASAKSSDHRPLTCVFDDVI